MTTTTQKIEAGKSYTANGVTRNVIFASLPNAREIVYTVGQRGTREYTVSGRAFRVWLGQA